MANTCSGEEKHQIIQNKTFKFHLQRDSTELKTKHLQISTLYTTRNETTIYKIRPSATKYIFSYIQDQNTNLYVQRPINNRKVGKLYWCLKTLIPGKFSKY